MLRAQPAGAVIRVVGEIRGLERAAQPDEIAATAVFLASDQARFYYGQMLSPNGGALML